MRLFLYFYISIHQIIKLKATTVSTKIISSTIVFNIDKKCSIIIDPEDWNKDAENSTLASEE